jgi:CheY-like chemotaxis protein
MSAKGTILVVDNESDQLDMMKRSSMRIGYDARTTDSPQQALEMVENQAFSLIIIDLIMPEIDGTELCEQIKQVRPTALRLRLFRPCAPLQRRTAGAGRV